VRLPNNNKLSLSLVGVSIECIDTAPPSPNSNENEFHANAPTFVEVEQADVVRLVTVPSDRALFICYPPPNDPMALNALQYFTGQMYDSRGFIPAKEHPPNTTI